MGKQLNWTLIACVLGMSAIFALFCLRLISNISLVTPLQLTTSGDEVSSIFAIWKYLNGQPVYTIPYEVPFTFSNFNWLFYAFFGSAAGFAMDLFSLADPWLPTITRLITLVGAIIGVWVTYAALIDLRKSEPGDKHRIDIIALGLAMLVFVGPLAGFWAITTRPDIWTTTIEAILLLGVLRLYARSALKAALWALVFGYIAWSFKTIDITVAVGVGVFFLMRRNWLAAFVLAVGTVLLWVSTYYLGNEEFRFSLLGIHLHAGLPFLLESGKRTILNFAIKSLPVLLPLIPIAWVVFRAGNTRQLLGRDWQLQFLFVVGLCTLTLNLLFSFKYGSAENYFFTPALILSCLVYKFLPCRESNLPIAKERLKFVILSFVCGWFLVAAASTSVILGLNGVISSQKMHDVVSRMQPCLSSLSPPIFVRNTYLSLPWITPGEPSFVISFHYNSDRASGRAFEAGGIGGMIDDGYFNSLIFETPLDAFDGASLDKYDLLQRTCGGWSIYQKSTP